MATKYVLVIGNGQSYYRPFRKFGTYTSEQALFKQPEDIALVVFTGGSDISPSLYGEEPSHLTSFFKQRDVFELIAFKRALKAELPMAGICRGAQFLCAMAGGKLVQHVTGHEWQQHGMKLFDDRRILVSSTHHQMMMPPEGAETLGWADPSRSDVYIGGADKAMEKPEKETEVAYFPNINAIGFQYHPEMMPEDSEGFTLVEEMVNSFLVGVAV